MRCPSCGLENPEGLKFCGECGAAVTAPCPRCGFAHPPPFKFCGDCGVSLVPASRPSPLSLAAQAQPSRRLAVRIGIHTGLVVVGEMGRGGRHEQLALGDTPNVAARLQGIAAPDMVVISAATHRLVRGDLTGADRGPQTLKCVAGSVPVYRLLGVSTPQSRLAVGRGIGKSRLVEAIRERVIGEHRRSLTWWRRFIAEGVIRSHDDARIPLPMFCRTVEASTGPLTDLSSPVDRAGLRLEQDETWVVPCPFVVGFREHGNATQFAREYILALRSWSESASLAALAPDLPAEGHGHLTPGFSGIHSCTKSPAK